MELGFDRVSHKNERLAFVRRYAAWVKRVPNEEWSRQQGALIDSFIGNAKNMPLTCREYLDRVADRRQNLR